MTEEDSTPQVEERPDETDHNSPYSTTQHILSRLDEYQIRVVLAFVQELLRD